MRITDRQLLNELRKAQGEMVGYWTDKLYDRIKWSVQESGHGGDYARKLADEIAAALRGKK